MTKAISRLLLAASLSLGTLAVPRLASADPAPAAQVAPGRAAPRPASPEEAQRYAEREEQAPGELSSFEGGRVVVVLSTAAAVIVVVILLLLIL
jgi:hypothetical protein